MAKHKAPPQESADVYEDPKLVEKVDAMMDPAEDEKKTKRPIEPEADPKQDQTEEEIPPLDIFADAPGAPPLDNKPQKTPAKKSPKVADQPDTPPAETLLEPNAGEDEDETSKVPPPKKPEGYDDPSTAQAIDEIVAHESDTVLAAQDQKLAQESTNEAAEAQPTHHIFWAFIAIICLIAIALAVLLADPSIHNPLSKVHWSNVRRHL